MPSQLPFPYNAWDLMNQGPQARVDLQNPRLAQQGLAGVLAQNLQQQGGEQNLQMAQQMQANPMAGMQGMQAMDTRALQQAEAAQRAGIGANNMAAAGQTNAITEVMQGIMGQGYGGQGSPGGLDALELAFAMMNQNPGEVREARDRAQFPSGWEKSDLNNYRRQDAAELENIAGLENLNNQFANFSPTEPLSVLKQLSAFVKSFDEGIVRQADVDNIREATGTTVDEWIRMATQFNKEGNKFPEKTGRRLMGALQDVVRERQANLVDAADRHEQFGDAVNWSEAARNTAIPNRKAIGKLRGRRANFVGARKHTLPDGSTVLVKKRPDGDYETIDPVTGEFTD